MCFQVETPKNITQLKTSLKPIKFDIEPGTDELLNRSVFPKNYGIILTQYQGKNKLHPATYSLIPHWMKTDEMKFSTYNSRSEDVLEKKTFKPYFINSRCLVPVKAFYEYSGKRGSNGRLIYRTSLKNNSLMIAAGIFSVWKDTTGKEHPTFAIMTIEPNARAKKFYERTPVILTNSEQWELWLDRDVKNPDVLQEVMSTWDDSNIVIEHIPKNGQPEIVLE